MLVNTYQTTRRHRNYTYIQVLTCAEIFLVSAEFSLDLGPAQPPYNGYQGLFPGGKVAGA